MHIELIGARLCRCHSSEIGIRRYSQDLAMLAFPLSQVYLSKVIPFSHTVEPRSESDMQCEVRFEPDALQNSDLAQQIVKSSSSQGARSYARRLA